ncbi:MAG: cytochrome ubiquinol oxidase subunit I [Candidatus Symbiothrix sp.]|jgi:cytochrome d ubiquinol oxidase subunit I|nr:cytochrome ubiquinol oxidase subunit I [Candidatus Symbiothrix sp.]
MDLSLIDWSRAQFALTAIFHWVFVPLTLGLGVIMCIFETIYYRTGDEKWKRLAKFWIKLFGINFAIGVATGIILEFEFGTNWSNYSYFVGDIFGAPLAIEGIIAFFLEATFIAVLFFGWNKVSKGFHLASTWITVIGATLSAWWILVANAWMQFPAGMDFNPDTARNEMTDFLAVALSPVAVNKFFHTVLSAWMLGAAFVIGVSSWFLLKKREHEFAVNSIKVAAIVGVVGIALTFWTGHSSAQKVAKYQPMKLAAMEALYQGKNGTELIGIGVVNPAKEAYNDSVKPVVAKIAFPKMLSWLATGDLDAFVPGIQDIIEGGYETENGTALSFDQKQEKGKIAQNALKVYRAAKADSIQNEKEACDSLRDARRVEYVQTMAVAREEIDANIGNLGYGYLNTPEETIPNVGLTFYAFHFMVIFGGYFLLFFIFAWFLNRKGVNGVWAKNKWLQLLGLISIPLAYLTSQAGWIVAEVGRQPWTIQDVLPVGASISKIPTSSVQITFFVFLTVFTVLLIAEVGIMLKSIQKGPENE